MFEPAKNYRRDKEDQISSRPHDPPLNMILHLSSIISTINLILLCSSIILLEGLEHSNLFSYLESFSNENVHLQLKQHRSPFNCSVIWFVDTAVVYSSRRFDIFLYQNNFSSIKHVSTDLHQWNHE